MSIQASSEIVLHPARWWERDAAGRAHCYLCPRHCRIHDGQNGFCQVRANRRGHLVTLAWCAPAAVHVDPIEKKPFHHVLPGARALSIGTAGCSLSCAFCQNWEIARARPSDRPATHVTPAELIALAKLHDCRSVAFTYNEPVVWAEYALETARAARTAGLVTLMVTNGYVTREAFADVFAPMDAVNVDLKALDEGFYRRVTLGSLSPVLETLVRLHLETPAWLEVTHLVIPGLTDGPEHLRRLAGWVAAFLGPDVPLHLTAFHPDHRMRDRPATPPETLRMAAAIARQEGLHFVYQGNVVGSGGDTHCPACGTTLIERRWFEVLSNRLDRGTCRACGAAVPGRWEASCARRS